MIYLFTDLDGTFIPEDRESEESLRKIEEAVKSSEIELIYVTGRNLKETKQAIRESHLPTPSYLICDVGSTIYQYKRWGYSRITEYWKQLKGIIGNQQWDNIETPVPLTLQERSKQNRYKHSYYFPAEREDELIGSIDKELLKKWSVVVSSVDTLGLLDILPKGVDKLYAINWLTVYLELDRTNIVFAGDSGNDLTVFNSPINVIVVNNCSERVKKMLKSDKSIYISNKTYTTGVLDGLSHFCGFKG